ncbi:helix-turn-helix transcriptional regulator [Roseimicrobium sp. ORNL1]|nr:helix-turn-helix transcriptional regulator [Roseimicrobium sp. ORNL1]
MMARPSQTDPRERAIVLALKEERLRQGISATKLAHDVNVSRSTITHLENDDARPTLWVLFRIADGLKVDLPTWMEKHCR